MNDILKNFLTIDDKIREYPTKFSKKLPVLEYITNNFEENTEYTEKEVNEIIKSMIKFEDFAEIRRDLCDLKYLSRTSDNKKYWKLKKELPEN